MQGHRQCSSNGSPLREACFCPSFRLPLEARSCCPRPIVLSVQVTTEPTPCDSDFLDPRHQERCRSTLRQSIVPSRCDPHANCELPGPRTDCPSAAQPLIALVALDQSLTCARCAVGSRSRCQKTCLISSRSGPSRSSVQTSRRGSSCTPFLPSEPQPLSHPVE